MAVTFIPSMCGNWGASFKNSTCCQETRCSPEYMRNSALLQDTLFSIPRLGSSSKELLHLSSTAFSKNFLEPTRLPAPQSYATGSFQDALWCTSFLGREPYPPSCTPNKTPPRLSYKHHPLWEASGSTQAWVFNACFPRDQTPWE